MPTCMQEHCQDPTAVLLLSEAANMLQYILVLDDSRKGLLVRLLLGGKATSVHAVVDGGIHPLIHRINLLFEVLWVDVNFRFLGNPIEGVVEHAYNVRTFIVHDATGLLVPEHWDSVLACAYAAPLLILFPEMYCLMTTDAHSHLKGLSSGICVLPLRMLMSSSAVLDDFEDRQ